MVNKKKERRRYANYYGRNSLSMVISLVSGAQSTSPLKASEIALRGTNVEPLRMSGATARLSFSPLTIM